MRGGAGHEVGLDDGEVLDDLVDPPVDRAREADLQLRGDEHLAERVREREPEELQLVAAQQTETLDRRCLVGQLPCVSSTPFGLPVVPEV